MQTRSIAIPTLFLSCAVFIVYLLSLVSIPEVMFGDPDTYWHIATGDLIRNLGALPEQDNWSFTAGNQHWFITSWGWDVLVSYFYEHAGWHGVIVMNSIIIAATLAVLFATCLTRSHDGISSFIATLLAAATLLDFSVRPHQLGLLFIAILMLLLAEISDRRLSLRWLLCLPLLMLLWANFYGGFIIGFFLLGFFALEAFLQKDWRRLGAIIASGILSLFACLLNPTGITFFYDLLIVGNDASQQLVHEWQGLQFTGANSAMLLYLFLFLSLVMIHPQPLAKRERWIGYVWLAMGLFSMRHMRIFAIVSAPLLALALKEIVTPKQRPPLSPIAQKLCRVGSNLLDNKRAAWGMAALSMTACVWLFSSSAIALYQTEHFNPLPDLSGEIAYVEKNYPHARLLNAYNLGGPLLFLTHGALPVFIDGRASTSYPAKLVNDYIAFHNASPGWEGIFDRYHVDGVIFLSTDNVFIDRFIARKGWHLAFKGHTATILMRDK